MNWIYKTIPMEDITQFPENTFGFVYMTTHKPTGKSYIGKKVLFHNQKKKLGKKELAALAGIVGRRPSYKLVVKESDWKTYWSSNKHLVKLEADDIRFRAKTEVVETKKLKPWPHVEKECYTRYWKNQMSFLMIIF